ncbi:hypothetical protein, partial [Klebsiella pneumoniae]|uniref:hypothetical protein n=1 Tax=Klebsiella pneumoniae TaxID=573 RepID=UPI0025A24DBE
MLRALAEVPEVTPPVEYEALLRPAWRDLVARGAAGSGASGSGSSETGEDGEEEEEEGGLADLVFS